MDQRIGIDNTHQDLGNACIDDGRCTGWRFANMAAGLQGHIHASAPCLLACLCDGHDFGVTMSKRLCHTTTNHTIIGDDYAANRWIGAGPMNSRLSTRQGLAHELFFH
jgi:hypothetical protein